MQSFAARVAIAFTTLVIIFLGGRKAIAKIRQDLKVVAMSRKLKDDPDALLRLKLTRAILKLKRKGKLWNDQIAEKLGITEEYLNELLAPVYKNHHKKLTAELEKRGITTDENLH